MSKNIILQMSMDRALELGLIFCECGHPLNSHYDWAKMSCANCQCEAYTPKPVHGIKFVKSDNPL